MGEKSQLSVTSVTLQICLRIRSVFSHYVFILLPSLKQTGGNCNSRYTCQKFPKCCWVFSRLGRLYLWNNFCKVLLWNNCSSRHKHTHILYTEHHWKHDSKHIFILTLGKWKRREEATIFPAMTMGHQPQTWLAKETTHIHKHYRSKQCFTLPDINTFKYYTDTTWACVYYMLVNIKSCNPHQKQLDALCCGNTQYVSEFTLYHCSPTEDSTAPVQHNAHEYHTYVRSHTSCDNFVSL